MFQASLCPSSVDQRTCYCIWCIVLVLLDVVGSGCGGAVLKELSTMWVSVRLSLHTLLTMHGHRNLNIRHLHTDLVAWMTRCLGFVRLWCKPCLIIEKHNFLLFCFHTALNLSFRRFPRFPILLFYRALLTSYIFCQTFNQGCTNPKCLITQVITFCVVVYNICGSPSCTWNLEVAH
jgi:hypothetical protein